MRQLIALLCLLLPLSALAQTNTQCLIAAEHMEARGESLRTAKAVLQVVQNRMRIDHMKACDVVRRSGAFPWAAKKHNWKVTHDMLTRHFKLVTMSPVVRFDTYYFNSIPPEYGRPYRRVGRLHFKLRDK